MADTILTPTQALAALGLAVTTEAATGARGQAQVRALATRDNSKVAVTIRDSEGEAVTALYNSVTAPARRTRR